MVLSNSEADPEAHYKGEDITEFIFKQKGSSFRIHVLKIVAYPTSWPKGVLKALFTL